MSNELPWSEKVPMFAINPDAAGANDVRRLAAELMHANYERINLQQKVIAFEKKLNDLAKENEQLIATVKYWLQP